LTGSETSLQESLTVGILLHGLAGLDIGNLDRCSIEAFDSEGKMAMTNLVFPSEPYNMIKVKGGKATIYEIKN
jgi:hypothetical protein